MSSCSRDEKRNLRNHTVGHGLVFQLDGYAIRVERRADVERLQERRCIDEDRRFGEVASSASSVQRSTSEFQDVSEGMGDRTFAQTRRQSVPGRALQGQSRCP